MKLLLTQNSELRSGGEVGDDQIIITLLLSSMSALFPTKILLTLSDACCSILRIQFLMSAIISTILSVKAEMIIWLTELGEGGFYCWRRTRQWHHRPTKCPSPHGNKLSKCKTGKLKNVIKKIFKLVLKEQMRKSLTGGDGAETFLTSSVPNLELDTFAIKLNGSDLKVNATSKRQKDED